MTIAWSSGVRTCSRTHRDAPAVSSGPRLRSWCEGGVPERRTTGPAGAPRSGNGPGPQTRPKSGDVRAAARMTCVGLGPREMERQSRICRNKVGRASGSLSRTTVSSLTRQEKPIWPTRDQFEIFVDTCLIYAGSRAPSSPVHLRDAEVLDRRYTDLSTQRAPHSGVIRTERPAAGHCPETTARRDLRVRRQSQGAG